MRLIVIQNPRWVTEVGISSLFILLCWGSFSLLHKETTPHFSPEIFAEYRGFINGLRSLSPPPQPGETIYFDSHPSYFDEDNLLSATQVAFGRTDLRVKLVTQFPAEAGYFLRFQNLRLIRVSQ